jgi:hypothetical protein
MKLTAFNGGLNLALAPHLIAANEAVNCVDVDFESGILKPLLGVSFSATVLSNTVTSFYYWLDGAGTFSQNFRNMDCEAEWVEYQEKLFWTSACEVPQVRIGSTDYDLGLQAPEFELGYIVKQQQASPRDVALAAGAIEGVGGTESRYYVPAIGLGTGTFPPVPGSIGYDLAYVNVTDPDLPKSQPTYMTRFASGMDDDPHGIDYIPYVEADVTPPEVPVAVPKMELEIYRKYNGRYIYIATMFNWYDTIAPIFEDDDSPEGPNDPIVYLENDYALQGSYTYGYTYYEPSTGAESLITLLPEFELNNELLWFDRSTIPVDTTIRIYRIGGNLTAFTLVGTTTYDSDEYFIDNLSDLDLAGNSIYDEGQVGAPPTDLRYLTELNAMFFGAKGDKLRFTPIGNPYAWPELNFLDFPSNITGIGKTSIGLLVFTLRETWLVTGNSPATLAQLRISGSQGCVKHHSISYTKNSCLWFSSEGLCTSSGANVILQSRPRLGKFALKPEDVKNAVLHDEKYYCLLANSLIFIADFNLNTFSYASSNVGVGHWLAIAPISDSDSNRVVWMLMQQGGSRKRGSLFTNTETNKRTWQYTTGFFIGQGLTKHKTYNKILAYVKPPVNFEISSDKGILINKAIGASEAEDIYTILIPSDKVRGKYLQLRMYGLGEVHEVEFMEGDANA